MLVHKLEEQECNLKCSEPEAMPLTFSQLLSLFLCSYFILFCFKEVKARKSSSRILQLEKSSGWTLISVILTL